MQTLAKIANKMSRQNAGDDSVIVNAGGSVTVVSGLTLSETKDIFQMMLRESLAGIQAEAMETAERRNEKLINDFLSAAQERFGEHVEEKLAQFRDPGAQYAFKSAQAEYCKYGNDSAEADAVELLMSRIGESKDTIENIIYDEAIKVCGRLSGNQIDLICTYLILHLVRFGTINNVEKIDDLIRRAGHHLAGLNCKSSELSIMAHVGVIQLHAGGAHWNPVTSILRGRYEGLMTDGLLIEDFNLPNCLENEAVIRYLRNPNLYQFNALTLVEWGMSLAQKGYDQNQIDAAVGVAKNNLWSDDRVFEYLIQVAPIFSDFRDILQSTKDGILSYNLTPIGIAIAIARIRRDGWQTDIRLSQLI